MTESILCAMLSNELICKANMVNTLKVDNSEITNVEIVSNVLSSISLIFKLPFSLLCKRDPRVTRTSM